VGEGAECEGLAEPVPLRSWMGSRKSAVRNKSQASRALLESLHGAGIPGRKASLYVWMAFRDSEAGHQLLQREGTSAPAAIVGFSPNQAFDQHMLPPQYWNGEERVETQIYFALCVCVCVCVCV
jgi:hypothetical protein